MEAQRAHLTGSMRVYSEVAEHNSETLSSEDYSNIEKVTHRLLESRQKPMFLTLKEGIFGLGISDYEETDDQEGKEATNDKVTPSLDSSSEYIPSEESEEENDEFELKFELIPLGRKKEIIS